MNEERDMKQVFDQNFSSLRFQAESRQRVIARTLRKEDPVMKKKISASMVFAFVLLLLAATALAAVVVIRSANLNKLNLAREALYEKYGLTPKTLGMFPYEGKEENGEYTLTWICDTYHPALTGVYTTVVKDGHAEASWSYDDVDKSVYDSGEFSAPVWGYKQLEASFENKEEASEYSLALYRQDDVNKVQAAPEAAPKPLKEGEIFWKDGEIIRTAEPDANALTRDRAFEIAVQALSEDSGIDKETIVASVITGEGFYLRDNGQTLWIFWFYVVDNGIEYGCGVTLDGVTGEVLFTDTLTGGNG